MVSVQPIAIAARGAAWDRDVIAYCRMSHRATVVYCTLMQLLGLERVRASTTARGPNGGIWSACRWSGELIQAASIFKVGMRLTST